MTRVHGWQRFYEEEMLETNDVRLPRLISTAQAAVLARREQLGADLRHGSGERRAIADAQTGLRVLSRELPES